MIYVKIEKLVIEEQCESIQNDLLSRLDGLDTKILDDVCQIIVDRFLIIKSNFIELK